MLNEENGESLYSFQDLARMLKAESESVTKCIIENHFRETIEVNGTQFIAEEHIHKFLCDYVAMLNINCGAYDLPEYLAGSTCRWARTLVDMYREKCVYPRSISPSQGELLKSTLCNIRPRLVVEIGCFIGDFNNLDGFCPGADDE